MVIEFPALRFPRGHPRCQIPILCRAGYRSGWRELCDKASKSALPMERQRALPRWPSELAPTARPTPQSGYG
jgi:hypothetical protein